MEYIDKETLIMMESYLHDGNGKTIVKKPYDLIYYTYDSIKSITFDKAAIIKGELLKDMFPDDDFLGFAHSFEDKKISFFIFIPDNYQYKEEKEKFVIFIMKDFEKLKEFISNYQYNYYTSCYGYNGVYVMVTQLGKDFYLVDYKFLFRGSLESLLKEFFGEDYNKNELYCNRSTMIKEWDKEEWKSFVFKEEY